MISAREEEQSGKIKKQIYQHPLPEEDTPQSLFLLSSVQSLCRSLPATILSSRTRLYSSLALLTCRRLLGLVRKERQEELVLF
jgi:hypothetical protein